MMLTTSLLRWISFDQILPSPVLIFFDLVQTPDVIHVPIITTLVLT